MVALYKEFFSQFLSIWPLHHKFSKNPCCHRTQQIYYLTYLWKNKFLARKGQTNLNHLLFQSIFRCKNLRPDCKDGHQFLLKVKQFGLNKNKQRSQYTSI